MFVVVMGGGATRETYTSMYMSDRLDPVSREQALQTRPAITRRSRSDARGRAGAGQGERAASREELKALVFFSLHIVHTSDTALFFRL